MENSKTFILWQNQVKWENHFTGRWNSYYTRWTKCRPLKYFFHMQLKILKYLDLVILANPLAGRLSNPALKAIPKYKNHPSIVATRNANNNCHFHFNEVSVEEVYKEIRKLIPRKSAQSTDIPIRVLKENADIFADYICRFFNESIKNLHFHPF